MRFLKLFVMVSALAFSGCATVMDRSLVNHPLMTFQDRLAQKKSFPLSSLGSDDLSTQQGCATCAK
jgi:hypothetical protein